MKSIILMTISLLFISCDQSSNSNSPIAKPDIIKRERESSKDFNRVDRLGNSNATTYIMKFDEGERRDASILLGLLKTKEFDFNLRVNIERLFSGIMRHKQSHLSLAIYRELIRGLIKERHLEQDDYSLILYKISESPFYLYDQDETKPESFTSLVEFIRTRRELLDTELAVVENFNKKFIVRN